MDVLIGASKSDQGTEHLEALVRPRLDALTSVLSGEYGGPMNLLWIDLELCPGDADHRPAFGFRFQKRVVTPKQLRVFGTREFFNVGHYSVRPDYFELARVPLSDVGCYLLRLIFDSTESLAGKRQLKGFDLGLFRQRFAAALAAQGCAEKSPGRAE
jgi:hypothetical protein